jgi:hypothetical protein
MPGATPTEAFDAFVTPLVDALECVVAPYSVQVTTSSGGRYSPNAIEHGLYLTGLDLGCRGFVDLDGDFRLRASWRYAFVEAPKAGACMIRITTCGYDYSVQRCDGTKVLDYHWHPTGLSHEKRPHVHIASSQLRADSVISNKQHMLTGRISFETVIRTLIDGLGVPPRQSDWSDLLDICEKPHLEHRSWSADAIQETGRQFDGPPGPPCAAA